jgi:hypothetical protein
MRSLYTPMEINAAVRAFKNPKSSLKDFIVRTYGFCGYCEEITEYGHASGWIGIKHIQCERCRLCFELKNENKPFDSQRCELGSGDCCYYIGTAAPKRAKASLRMLHSRKTQAKFFREAIRQHIRETRERIKNAEGTLKYESGYKAMLTKALRGV